MSFKKAAIGIILAIGIALIAIFGHGLYSPSSDKAVESASTESGVKVVSTNPDNLDGATVSPTQTLEITFNKPMVRDNTRIEIEPKADYTTDLSADHKTIKVMPKLDLGQSYTLTIKSGYGTDTNEKLDQDLNFHFQTITYSGV